MSYDSYQNGKLWSEVNRAAAEECDEQARDLAAPEVNTLRWLQGCVEQSEVRESRSGDLPSGY